MTKSSMSQQAKNLQKIWLEHEGNLTEKELLSIILSLKTTRKMNMNKADQLLNQFSGLYGLGQANFEDLIAKGEINEEQAIILKTALEIGRKWICEAKEPLLEVSSSYEVYQYIYPQMKNLTKELFKVILLNSQNQIIKNLDAFRGTVMGAPVYIREVMELGLKHHGASFIFVHNHPSGTSTPSKWDILLTQKLVMAGEILKIPVNDHIIIGEQEYYSFLDHGLIDDYKDFIFKQLAFQMD